VNRPGFRRPSEHRVDLNPVLRREKVVGEVECSSYVLLSSSTAAVHLSAKWTIICSLHSLW